MQVYQYRKPASAIAPRVDAIYINGGGWDAPPAIDILERDLGTKVVFAWRRKCAAINGWRSIRWSGIAACCCATIPRCRRRTKRTG